MQKVGIWIDQREANIITLIKGSIAAKTIYSGIETRVRIDGEKKQFGRFGDQYLVNEKGKKNKIESSTNKFLNRVNKNLKNADQIILFGPAQMKSKLEKLILNSPETSFKLQEVMVSENMTDNQKIAFVKDYYKNH